MRIKSVTIIILLFVYAGAAYAGLVFLPDGSLGVEYNGVIVPAGNPVLVFVPTDPFVLPSLGLPGISFLEPISFVPSDSYWIPADFLDIEMLLGLNEPVYVIYPDGSMTMYIPEPASCFLMGVGCLYLIRRRAG